MRIGKAGLYVSGINQLGAFRPRNWGRWNWYDIDWLHISTEVGGHAGYKGVWYAEIMVIVCGLGFCVEYVADVPARRKWGDDLMTKWGLD